MNLFDVLALALDPGFLLRARGIEPDPWQQRLLLSDDRQILLNCSRQSGKSTTVAVLALHTALCRAHSLVLLLSPSLRQSMELFRKVLDCFNAIRRIMPVMGLNQTRVEFRNGSRIVCLPGKEETIRSFSGVNLLVIDEAARVPDDLYRSVRPMLAVSRGRLICLSTPFGKRGFFYEEWQRSSAFGIRPSALGLMPNDQGLMPDWLRIRIPWQKCPRIGADFIDLEKRSMGESWIRQEYECSFEALEGLVFPDFEEQTNPSSEQCAVNSGQATAHCTLPTAGRRVGGIDFGFRNPFCALWGVLDRDDVLWISDERYVREAPLHEHVAALLEAENRGLRIEDRGLKSEDREAGARSSILHPRPSIVWYADPAGRTEIEELRHAGLKVIRGNNAIEAGIAAINARLRTGRLKVLRAPRQSAAAGAATSATKNTKTHESALRGSSCSSWMGSYTGCPNLLAEVKLYRYPSSPEAGGSGSRATSATSEIPIDQHNHALAALRYLVSRLDAGFMAKFRHRSVGSRQWAEGREQGPLPTASCVMPTGQRRQMRLDNEESWKTVITGP